MYPRRRALRRVVLDDEQFKPAEDATDIENETSTPTGKRKPGRPKKNA